MYLLYALSVVIHVLAAALWVGGMGLFALVVVPVARRILGEAQARELLRAAGARFASIGWIALGLLLVTGVANLAFRGVLSLVPTLGFWRTPFGSTLAMKLVFVALALIASLAHARDARHRTEVALDRAPTPTSRVLGRATLLLSVAVVVLAVLLVRGTPW
jgi:putative copper export protein